MPKEQIYQVMSKDGKIISTTKTETAAIVVMKAFDYLNPYIYPKTVNKKGK